MDSVNREIISYLLRDGRATYQEIGQRVGLSAPAVKRRVDQMIARKEIAGFTAVIDPASLGWETEAYIELSYQGNVSTKRLKHDLEQIPQVVGVWTVSGDADALVHVMAASMAEIEKTVESMREIRNVDRTRSVIVMSRVLDRPRV
ncbi:AsnC family transcriptional regulator [Aeromicrobium sp. A1-2]|uniref:Lrp/AsnC family transcriptional regulator n=1 Tax=Aeromicrobium sp. A1-2 TaxID=2107713 RepID=UPI000E55074F|nr:Lrp/AsnC family transcriptional regulator [Aeromicrobium sp. A1-2]AXT86182.1 AsnC family transcriptional regulator [Aeromicrobium sp. A1-2]